MTENQSPYLAGTAFETEGRLTRILNQLYYSSFVEGAASNHKDWLQAQLNRTFLHNELLGTTIPQLGLSSNEPVSISCNPFISGCLADIVRVDAITPKNRQSFILYVSERKNGPIEETFEGLERLYAAGQSRLTTEGKEWLRVPKPYNIGSLRLGSIRKKEYGAMTMEYVTDGYTAVYHGINRDMEPRLVQIDHDHKLTVVSDQYEKDLDDLALMYGLMYRLLDGQFPQNPRLETGNYLAKKSTTDHLSFCVTDVGPDLQTFASDEDWISTVRNLVETPMIYSGTLHNFRPYAHVDFAWALQRADALLLRQ